MENKQLTLGSLFDGSGGFPLGGLLCGIEPKWASEVEPFAIRVTTKRLPQVKHLGDVSKIHGGEIEPVDIITFGSPCQDMSIAGKRAGLEGSRSNLFYEAIRIVKEMRCATNGKYPRYIVWENVPGAFSSNKGEDFRAVLEAVCSVKGELSVPEPTKGKWTGAGEIVGDGFSAAWRTVDAQYWGVPQRRRRIYLVADFDGECAGKVLFESEGVSGYPAPGLFPRQRAAGASEESLGTSSLCLNDQGGQYMNVSEGVTGTLRARMDGHPPVVFENHSQDTRYTGPLDVAQTVSANYGMGGNNQPFVVETPKTLKIRSGCEGCGCPVDTSRSQTEKHRPNREVRSGKGALVQDNLSATLATNNDQTVFVPKAYGICSKSSHSMLSDNPKSGFYEATTSRTLDCGGGNPTCNQGGIAVVEGCGCPVDTSQPQAEKHRPSRQARPGSRPSHLGDGYKESDVMYTLNTVDRHAVAYGIDRATYNMGQNAQFNISVQEEVEPTLVAKGPGAVAHPTYSTSKNSYHTVAETELANTLVATDYKDPPTVNDMDSELQYIVRRLTPTECARLQGFPDWWCADLGTKLPSDEELAWWSDVFETQRKICGTSAKPKSRKQIFKWLQNPHSDAAEYKLWGNGVALPNVCFVLAGIVYYTQNPPQ